MFLKVNKIKMSENVKRWSFLNKIKERDYFYKFIIILGYACEYPSIFYLKKIKK